MRNLQISDSYEVHLYRHEEPLFYYKHTQHFQLPLLPEGAPLNITIKDETTFNMSCIHILHPIHEWRSLITKVLRSNSWTTQIEDDELITGEHALEMLHFLQSRCFKKATIGLSKCAPSSDTNLHLQAKFGQIESNKL